MGQSRSFGGGSSSVDFNVDGFIDETFFSSICRIASAFFSILSTYNSLKKQKIISTNFIFLTYAICFGTNDAPV
jgi:hypothetical protein